MRFRWIGISLLPVSFFLLALTAFAQEMVTEPSTGKKFPAVQSFSAGGKEYSVQLTGVAVRKKVIFKVYGMAHHMENPAGGTRAGAIKDVLTDGKAKQITMVFVRDVDATSIQKAYRDGFAENASKQELPQIQGLIDKFVGNFTTEVKENDVFILRWLPGGTIIPVIKEQEKEPLTNQVFARVLWTIWFGDDSIVDPDDLVARVAK
jgi:hypothetical protein